MENDFEKWLKIKSFVDQLDSDQIYFDEREIWWCYLGKNIGIEQNGKGDKLIRPVIIIKKFSRKIIWIIPLSTRTSTGDFFFPLLAESNKIRIAILPQMKMIDSKRLINKMDLISTYEHGLIKKALTAFLQ